MARSKESLPNNLLCFYNNIGETSASYSKVDPFTFSGENKSFESGDALGCIQLAGRRISYPGCYDLRFSVLCSAIASSVDTIVGIANWPAVGFHIGENQGQS